MAFFNNKRKDFSIQPPKQEIANGAFTVSDTANIDFTYILNNLTANLTTTGVTAGTYGDATNVPQFTVDIFGRITGVTLVPITGGGSAAWGSIGAGTGVASQTDLITYLNANYYPIPTGTTAQYIRGDGSLATFPSSGEATSVYLENTFAVGTQSTSIIYVSSVNKIYVANLTSANVQIIDGSTGIILSTLSGVTGALTLKYISSINEVWVTSSSVASIRRIDPTTNTEILPAISTGITANGVNILEYSATKVFITVLAGSGRIMVIDPSTLSLATNITVNVPSFPSGMALNDNPVSSQFGSVVIGALSGIFILDPTTNTVSTTLANPSSAISSARNIKYSTLYDVYYITSQGTNTLVRLDIASSTTFTATSIQATLPSDLEIDDSSDSLFVCVLNSANNVVCYIKHYKISNMSIKNTMLTTTLGGSSNYSAYLDIDKTTKTLYMVGRGNTSVIQNSLTIARYV